MAAAFSLSAAGMPRSLGEARVTYAPCVKGRMTPETTLARERWTMSDEYKFGIEEEYFLVDAETKSVAREMPPTFLEKLKSVTDGQAMGEMLQSQLEVATAPHTSIKDARTELRFLRQTVANIAAEGDLAFVGAESGRAL
jgi:hypothetical protein